MVTPEESMWFVGGTGIQTEGEMEETCSDDNPYDTIGVIIVGIVILALFLYVTFLL